MARLQAAQTLVADDLKHARAFFEQRLAGHFAANPTKLDDPSFILDCAIHYVASADKNLERKNQEIRRLRTANTIDELTQITNGVGFDKALKQALARAQRYQEIGVMVLFDIDQFRQINDLYGRAVGDAVLSLVAELLRRNIRTSDAAARLSADIFAVLLINTTAETGRMHANRLQDLLNSQIVSESDNPIALRTHTGLVEYGPNSQVEELMAAARQVLYRNKIL